MADLMSVSVGKPPMICEEKIRLVGRCARATQFYSFFVGKLQDEMGSAAFGDTMKIVRDASVRGGGFGA